MVAIVVPSSTVPSEIGAMALRDTELASVRIRKEGNLEHGRHVKKGRQRPPQTPDIKAATACQGGPGPCGAAASWCYGKIP